MATKHLKSKKRDRVWARKHEDGTTTYQAVVRIRPFDVASKAFPTRAAAKDWADTQVEMLRTKKKQGGELRTDIMSLALKEFIELYLDDHETKKLRTFDDVERLCAWWVSHYGAVKIMDLGPLKLHEARDLLHKGGRAEGTVNRYLGALRSAWSWGKSLGIITKEAMDWPEKKLFMSEPEERVRFLDDAELAALMSAVEKHSVWMRAAVLTSLATGLRQGELLRLEWKNIDFDKKTLVVLRSKKKKLQRRLVHLASPAVDALKQLRREGVVGPARVFVYEDGSPIDKSRLRVQWLKVLASSGVQDFHWHDLRHTTASYLGHAGASLPEIGSVLGHSNPATTQKYTHFVAGKPVHGSAELAAKLGAKL